MSMLKRNAAVVVLAGLVLGGAAVAWAGGSPARPTVVAAAQTGDTTTPPDTPPTPADRNARRAAARACLEGAGEDTAARRACLDAAGLHKRGGPTHGGGPLGGLGMLGRAVHGSVVVPGTAEGTWQTVTFDRGTVNEATDGDTIVLDRPDGEKVTLALTADTTFHGVADAAAIQEGKPAMVVSKGGTATRVGQRDPAHAGRQGHPRPGNNGEPPVVHND